MGGENFPPARNVSAAKPCDACKSAPSILFCRNDHMYMCITCDSKLHANNRHARVWLCDVCEQGPSSVTCKADAASLCVTCDRDIHSANSLASRHDRVPVVPFYEPVVFLLKSVGNVFLDGPATPAADESEAAVIEDHASSCPRNEEESNNSWLSFNNNVCNKISAADMKSMELLFTDPENLLEFDYPAPDETEHSLYKHRPETDSVVPVQVNSKPPVQAPSILMDESSSNKHFEIDFTNSKIVSFTTPQLNSQNANNCELREQASSKTVVMPDYGSSISEMSSLGMNIELTKAKSSEMIGRITDREARVMRYREKRKNRKFEKTIRYASRKAYAETRPRVKGRFVKRSKMEIDSHNRDNGDRWFTLDRGMNSTFGVVPKLDRMY